MVISRNVRNPKIVGNPMIGMDRETLSREETDFHGFRDFWKCRDYRVCWNFRVYWNYRMYRDSRKFWKFWKSWNPDSTKQYFKASIESSGLSEFPKFLGISTHIENFDSFKKSNIIKIKFAGTRPDLEINSHLVPKISGSRTLLIINKLLIFMEIRFWEYN